MLDHGAAGLLNRGTGPAAVEAGGDPTGKGSRPALPTCLRRNYIHATPILRGLGCNCNVAKPSGQRWGPAIGSSSGVQLRPRTWAPISREACGLLCYQVLPVSSSVGIRELRQRAKCCWAARKALKPPMTSGAIDCIHPEWSRRSRCARAGRVVHGCLPFLGFLVAPSPRSSTKRMVSLIARPSWLPTSARRRINSSESRRLMRWLVLARGAREPDEK